jgi:hypothetical protein
VPKQVNSADEFKKLVPSANLLKVVRMDDKVKLKLRTKKTLYTYVASKDEAEALIKDSKLEVDEY